MSKRPIGLTILYWTEVIVSARVLLFTVPVLITRNQSGNLTAMQLSDWFILQLTIISFLYAFVGVSGIIGHKLAKFFHFIATVVALVLTVGIVKTGASSIPGLTWIHYMPLALSVVSSLFIAVNRNKG